MKSSLLRILAAALCALSIGNGTGYAQEVSLVYKFKPGNVDHYRETSRTVMSAEAMPGGSQVFTNATYISMTTKASNSDGGAELIRVIDSTYSTMNDRPFENPGTRGAVGFPLNVKVASNGKVLDVQAVKDSLDEGARAVLEAFRSQLVSQPSFPSKPVRVGGTWRDSSRITQQTQMGNLTTTIRYSATLTGADTVSKTPVWVVKMKIELSGAIDGGVGTVDGTGEGAVYFSGILGKEIRSSLEMNQTMNVSSPQGAMTMTMKTTTTRELLR